MKVCDGSYQINHFVDIHLKTKSFSSFYIIKKTKPSTNIKLHSISKLSALHCCSFLPLYITFGITLCCPSCDSQSYLMECFHSRGLHYNTSLIPNSHSTDLLVLLEEAKETRLPTCGWRTFCDMVLMDSVNICSIWRLWGVGCLIRLYPCTYRNNVSETYT